MLGQVPDTAGGSEFADESESVWDEAGAHRVTEMSDTIRVDSSILSIDRCRMAGRTWRGHGVTRRKRSARPDSPSAKLNFRQLDTSTRHMERTCGSCQWMVGSAQSSAAPRFWCCYSLDHIARAPRLDGPSHNETLVGPRPCLGMGTTFVRGLIQLSPRKWISSLCLHEKDPGTL